MESRDHRDDLEIFLKEKSDSYKMYPSEKIWTNLNNQLHPRKKWPYMVMAVIFLGLGVGGKIYDTRMSTLSLLRMDALKSRLGLTPAEPKLVNPVALSQSIAAEKEISTPALSNNTFPVENENSLPLRTRSLTTGGSSRAGVTSLPARAGSLPPEAGSASGENKTFLADHKAAKVIPFSTPTNFFQGMSSHANSLPAEEALTNLPNSATASISETEPKSFQRAIDKPSLESSGDIKAGNAVAANKDYGNNIHIEKTPLVANVTHAGTTNADQIATTNAIRVKKPYANRLGLQLYFSPTMSYRKLSGNVNSNVLYNIANAPNSTSSPTDLKTAVSHSPAVGMELGTAMIFSVNKRIRIKGGLQFNYSQYNIAAYDYSAEITPLSASGIGHTQINAVSHHRNFNGFSNAILKNEHFMISVPVGAELMVLGNKLVQFNLGATVQPGLMLNNQAYLLSTNLTNYAKVPSLYRNFNINSSLEAFLSVQLGSIKWSVGPQLRYQLLSTYKKAYPFNERLFDYGLKFGLTKTLK